MCLTQRERAQMWFHAADYTTESIGNRGHSCPGPLEHKPIRASVICSSLCFPSPPFGLSLFLLGSWFQMRNTYKTELVFLYLKTV